MNKFRKYFLTLAFASCFFLPSNTFAQGGPGDPGCDPLDPACPIDGGLSLLIAAGIGIGARKAYIQKKKEAVKF